MKKLAFAVLSLFALKALPAQSPVYVLFNPSCMDQLEYRYTKSGTSVFAYSIRPNADEQYIFMSGSNGMPTQSLPDGVYDCRNLSLSDEAVRSINQNSATRQMYFIIQRPEDYLMMPVYSATQIKRVGSYYLLVSPKYVFAIDTTRLSYQDNLQGEASPSIIRFTGSKLANCRYQYAFHGEPARNYSESMDFDFIFGIGIVNSRIGATTAESQENEMRLVGVNGNHFESYLADICKTSVAANTAGNSASKWTGTAEYGYLGEDKESSSVGTTWQPGASSGQVGPVPLANCPEAPGAGYHIVQPRESLNAISRTYNVDLKSIIKWNNISNPDHIEICQKIWLQKPPAGASSAKGAVSPSQYSTSSAQKWQATVYNQSVYWNTGATGYVAPSQYSYTSGQSGAQAGVHYVQKGETLFGIAKRYSCAEECIRRANNMPLQGNVTIKTGETLIIPECTCLYPSGADAPRTSTPTVPREVSNILNTKTQTQTPLSPTVYDYKTDPYRFQETPVTKTLAPAQQGGDQQTLPPPTQEYIVRQGENLNSIAIKFNMNVAELAQLNSMATDEKLIPGKRLVVRRY